MNRNEMRAAGEFERVLREAETRDVLRELTGVELLQELLRSTARCIRVWAAAWLRLMGFPSRVQMLLRPLGLVALALLIEAASRF